MSSFAYPSVDPHLVIFGLLLYCRVLEVVRNDTDGVCLLPRLPGVSAF